MKTDACIREQKESRIRLLYRDLLGGREVWPKAHASHTRSYWFDLNGQLVEVIDESASTRAVLTIEVEAPLKLIERCWDAGYTILMHEEGNRVQASIMDPVGRCIDLLPRS